HARELGRAFILGDHRAAHLLDRPDAHRSITARSGEDDGYGPILVARRHRLEQQVRAGPHEMDQLGLRQGQRPVGIDEQVAVGRRDVDGPGYHPVAFAGLHHFELGPPAQDVGHQAAVAVIGVSWGSMQETLEEQIPPVLHSMRLLDGEDPLTRQPEDARHWVLVYEQLFHLKSELLARTRARIGTMLPAAQKELKQTDLALMLRDSERLYERLQFWQVRAELLGPSQQA